ncbi:hypothetical protein D9M72_564470 [compost metagenome]
MNAAQRMRLLLRDLLLQRRACDIGKTLAGNGGIAVNDGTIPAKNTILAVAKELRRTPAPTVSAACTQHAMLDLEMLFRFKAPAPLCSDKAVVVRVDHPSPAQEPAIHRRTELLERHRKPRQNRAAHVNDLAGRICRPSVADHTFDDPHCLQYLRPDFVR